MVEKDKTKKVFGIPFYAVFSAVALFIVLITSAALGSYLWVHPFPVGHDFSTHASASLKLLYALENEKVGVDDVFAFVPVRYTPLTYFIAALAHWVSGYSYLSFALTMVIVFIFALFGLIAIGWRLHPYSFEALLPLLIMFATSTFWTISVSFNLELTLLMACSWFFFILFTMPSVKNRLVLGAMILLAIVLIYSKLIILIHVIPGMILFYISARKNKPWRYFFLSVGLFILVIYWLHIHSFTLLPELKVDYFGMVIAPDRRLDFYPLLIVKNYLGVVLLIGLSLLLLLRFLVRNFNKIDLVFLLAFALPFTFFTILATKWEWYILESYLVLGMWFCYSSAQLSGNRSAKLISLLVFGFYSIVAVFNLYYVLNSSSNPEINDFLFTSENREIWNHGNENQVLAEELVDRLEKEPLATFAVDISDSEMDHRSVMTTVMMKKPKHSLLNRTVFRQRSIEGEGVFLDCLAHSTYVIAPENFWEEYQQSIFKLPLSKNIAQQAAQNISSYQALYEKDKIIFTKKSKPLLIYKNKNPEATIMNKVMAEIDPRYIPFHFDAMDEKGEELLNSGRADIAVDIFRLGLQISFEKNSSGLMESLVRTARYDEVDALAMAFFINGNIRTEKWIIDFLLRMNDSNPEQTRLKSIAEKYQPLLNNP